MYSSQTAVGKKILYRQIIQKQVFFYFYSITTGSAVLCRIYDVNQCLNLLILPNLISGQHELTDNGHPFCHKGFLQDRESVLCRTPAGCKDNGFFTVTPFQARNRPIDCRRGLEGPDRRADDDQVSCRDIDGLRFDLIALFLYLHRWNAE